MSKSSKRLRGENREPDHKVPAHAVGGLEVHPNAAIEHPYERRSVVLLYRAGWSVGELAMTFQVGEQAIRRTMAAVVGEGDEESGEVFDDGE